MELIALKICRKSNSKRPDEPYQAFIKNTMRKRIETTISEIVELIPHSIHAVTMPGLVVRILNICRQTLYKTLNNIQINKMNPKLKKASG